MTKLSKREKPTKINPKQVHKSYCDKLHDDLESKGIDFFSPAENGGSLHINKDYLSLPSDITEVSTKDLGEYLNAFTQQKAYLRTLLGWSEMYAEDARKKYFEVSSPRYRELLNSKLSETAKEREVNSYDDVRPAFEAFNDYRNQVKLINYNIASVEDIIFMLSREMTRRVGDFKEDTRNYNVNKK